MNANRIHPSLRVAIFLGLTTPLLLLARDYMEGILASPFRTIVQETGVWSVRLLVLGLLIAPLRDVTGWTWPLALRRMIGLFAAFYAAVHAVAWMRQYGFDWTFLLGEAMRPWLLIGALGALVMVPMVLTSASFMHRLLGPATWARIHKLVYAAAVLAVVHYALARGLTRLEMPVAVLLVLFAFVWRVARPRLARAQTL